MAPLAWLSSGDVAQGVTVVQPLLVIFIHVAFGFAPCF